jgi:hypothetical protein
MYLYNVTYKIDHSIESFWLQWMRLNHIPKVVRTGNFLGHRVCKLLDMEEEDGVTYAVQYLCPDISTFKAYQQDYASDQKEEHSKQFLNQYVSFSTVLEIIE